MTALPKGAALNERGGIELDPGIGSCVAWRIAADMLDAAIETFGWEDLPEATEDAAAHVRRTLGAVTAELDRRADISDRFWDVDGRAILEALQ